MNDDCFEKKSGKEFIIFPLDVPSVRDGMKYVDLLKDHVGLFKIGLELFIRSGFEIVSYIRTHSKAGIFLDLKLYDIPATVFNAMKSVISLNVNFITVHCGDSLEILISAVKGSEGKTGVLGVTVLTSISGNDLLSAGYKDEYGSDVQKLVLHRATLAKKAGCAGVICSGAEVPLIKQMAGNRFLTITPGIRSSSDVVQNDDQKRVMTPCEAVKLGADYLVIGRPIRNAVNPVEAAVRIAEEIDTARMTRDRICHT